MKQNVPLTAFNRGIVSPLALARVDAKQVALAAEIQTNWLPRKLGPMSLRPGLGHVGGIRGNAITRLLPFAFAIGDTALIELTPGIARFWVNDALVTFPSVATAITNGDFTVDLAGWTDADDAGCASSWLAGEMVLSAEFTLGQAKRYQLVAVPAGDAGKVHAVRISISAGVCVVRIGSTVSGQEYVEDTELTQGGSTLAFIPTGGFYVQLMSKDKVPVLISSVALVEGVLEAPTEWTTQEQLDAIRIDQSGDVIFVACGADTRQKRIERRANGAWSVVEYLTNEGPLLPVNATEVTLAFGVAFGYPKGYIGLISSRPVFKQGHVGSIFSLVLPGQQAVATLVASDTYTDAIRITGSGVARNLGVDISGVWVGTLTLQRSIGEPGLWEDTATTYVANGSTTFNDGLDNQVIYYRVGFKAGAWTSGSASISLKYNGGQTTVPVRVTVFSTETIVFGVMLKIASSPRPVTTEWYEGAWSDVRGYPSAVALNESRLCWAGKSKVWCSISDNYHGFDQDFEGDAGPISRSIGSGMVDSIRWLRSVGRLLAGGEGKEHSIRSSSLDEPITPVNFNIKAYSGKGSSNVDAVTVDQSVIFVDRSGKRVQILSPGDGGNHQAVEATMLAAEVGEPGIIRLAVQQSPEIRLHCVRSDGKVAVLVYDQVEEVQAWMIVETDGIIEDAVSLPASGQDEMYYVVKRTINGAQVRNIEKWAHDADCVGGTINKQADAFLQFTNGVPSVTVAGFSHLIGETVVCWADGQDQGTFVVSAGGTITLPSAVSAGVVGLPYTARYKSVKLAHAAQGGTALTQVKRVDHLALILADTHYQGLRYGPDFDTLDDLPLVEQGVTTPANTVWEAYDGESVEFNGIYDTDARICLVAQAPRPCTVMAAVISMKTNDKL